MIEKWHLLSDDRFSFRDGMQGEGVYSRAQDCNPVAVGVEPLPRGCGAHGGFQGCHLRGIEQVADT